MTFENLPQNDKRGSGRLRKTLEANVKERIPESGGNITRSSPQQRRHTPSISRGSVMEINGLNESVEGESFIRGIEMSTA